MELKALHIGFLSARVPKLVAALVSIGISTSVYAQPPPVITGIDPTSGPVGTAVSIYGANFNPTPSNNIVYFGAVRATVTSGNSVYLGVTVPVSATYQPVSVTSNGATGYSRTPYSVVSSSSRTIEASSFVMGGPFSTTTPSYGTAVGDFDRDGKPDIAAGNEGSNSISVFRNVSSTGTLVFLIRVDFAPGSTPRGNAAGDVDGDGKLDIFVCNQSGNSVSVLKNNSSGGSLSFAAHLSFEMGTEPFDIRPTDLDGDSKPDVVAANTTANTVSILQNTSTSDAVLCVIALSTT